MKSQASTTSTPFSLPAQNFGFLAQLFEAMPIVIFIKAIQEAAKTGR